MNYYADENWHVDFSQMLSDEKLGLIADYLNKRGFVAVLHSHFCGARSPTPSAFDDIDEFREYLRTEVRPGDIIKVWPFPEGEPMIIGKSPDEKGRIPKVGAY